MTTPRAAPAGCPIIGAAANTWGKRGAVRRQGTCHDPARRAMMGRMASVRFHTMPDGRRIAFRHTTGKGPLIVFLPGYMSDMEGSKATAIFARADAEGRACLLLDYSGCGESLGKDRGGDFADGTLTRWCEEVLALIDHAASGPVVLVGLSMGGWLALMTGIRLGERLAGLVGIAAPPDFSDWGYSGEQKARLDAGEIVP